MINWKESHLRLPDIRKEVILYINKEKVTLGYFTGHWAYNGEEPIFCYTGQNEPQNDEEWFEVTHWTEFNHPITDPTHLQSR